jgi:hypothetical protein
METLAQQTVKTPDPQAATPYFVRVRRFRRAVVAECARRGWPPPPAA